MAALVGMDENRFSSTFADDVQFFCASGSDCKVHSGASPVDLYIHRCMNCALKFHYCITCSGVRFSDWISGAAASARGMLSQYGREKFDCYKDDFSSSPLELCSNCQNSIALSIDVGHSCSTAVVTVTFAPATAAADAMGTTPDDLLSSGEHYKKNHNSLKILVVMCHGLKNKDNSDPALRAISKAMRVRRYNAERIAQYSRSRATLDATDRRHRASICPVSPHRTPW